MLDTSTGSFSGTAVGPPGTVFYTAKVKRGELETTAQVTVNVLRVDTPPPRETECLGGTIIAAPGESIRLDDLGCVSDNYPLTSRGVSPANLHTAWGATWAGDEDEIGASDKISFRATVPSGTAPGIYTFTNRIEDNTGVAKDLSVAVTVTADPSINIAAHMLRLNQEASRGFTHIITATGGQASGNYTFTSLSAVPSWITFDTSQTNALRLVATAQNRDTSGSFTFRVQKGGLPNPGKVFRFTYVLRTDDDGEA